MFENFQICPYTGLRSFTEEESLYFKGREDHITHATEQLQRNKFLMLTGASGDGKSSLVYAGIIPNARAGFLKSKYSHWNVADFRPERSPFRNLCRSLAKQLGIADSTTVESELQHGFSALVDLYKNSPLYIDTDSVTWKRADDAGKSAIKREAANLIILIDQFEEFFTNPENYHHGVPSVDSNLVLNVLLETARLALEEDLPIYIIFTMRSDYIGQCAAFRGLPEYIGFSQFFVPRLNRQQLQQVIEEPATLSGNRITRRLTERLIHDISEGVDQLPILQHALNQIWVAANKGIEEMDLVHYAMVGGMPVRELPDTDIGRFNTWFATLSPKIQHFYSEPNLQNVLDTHANKLLVESPDYYQQKSGKAIDPDDAGWIIKKVFTCLTKIDQSRAVRNRMTLNEIVNIIGRPDLDVKAVGTLLNVFREPGNTLIRPFIGDEPESRELSGDQVLDITHESLIRNWESLEQWAQEEFDSFTVSLDFEQQLSRWVQSGKSNAFLLSIGPLTYFENWYDKAKPNAWWIARYLPEADKSSKYERAKEVLDNAKEFLKRSASKHLVTRTMMRYGARRIAAVLGVIAILILSSFVIVDRYKRQNKYVLEQTIKTAEQLAANPDVLVRSRAMLLTQEIQLGLTTIPQIANAVKDPVERVNIINGISTALIYQGRTKAEKETVLSLFMADSLMDKLPPAENVASASRILKEINDFRENAELAYFYKPLPGIDAVRKSNAARSALWSLYLLQQQPPSFTHIGNLNVALEHGLNYKIFSADDVNKLIAILSPFDGNKQSPWIAERFKADITCGKGFYSYGFSFNGLYQELAYLYAAVGDVPHTLQCIDTLLVYNKNYFQNDYEATPDNASHIANIFYQYGHERELDEFVKGYIAKKKITIDKFYAFLLGRCKLYEFSTTVMNWDPDYDFNLNLSLEYADETTIDYFFSKYHTALATIKDPDERNFMTALAFKDQGIIQLRRLDIRGHDSLASKYVHYFDKAVAMYKTVSAEYLKKSQPVVEITRNDDIAIPRKFLFVFPDVRTAFHPNEPRLFHFFYTTSAFLNYIVDRNLFDELYKEQRDLQFLDVYLRDYHFVVQDPNYSVSNPVPYETLVKLEKNLARRGADSVVNLNYLYIYLGEGALTRNDKTAAQYYYGKLTSERLKSLFINSFDPDFLFRVIGNGVANLTKLGLHADAVRMTKLFDDPANRSTLYAYAACELQRTGGEAKDATLLLDSAIHELTRIEGNNQTGQERLLIAYGLAMRHQGSDVRDAYAVMKNVEAKNIGINRITRSYGFNNDVYGAITTIPDRTSPNDHSILLWNMLNGYCEKDQTAAHTGDWSWYNAHFVAQFDKYINYVND